MKDYQRLPPLSREFVLGGDPFVLLETNRYSAQEYTSYFFANPITTLVARSQGEIPELLAQIEERSRSHYVAGYFSYEFGHYFHPNLTARSQGPLPLAWLGVFDDVVVFDHRIDRSPGALNQRYFDRGASEEMPAEVTGAEFDISPEAYASKIAHIKELIARGDTYQVNFTGKVKFGFDGQPYDLYQKLKRNQNVSYSACIRTPETDIISISPELFFRRVGNTLTVRPMKGTMPRGYDREEDATAARRLVNDEKNRAENLMIVDLMRNDLGRISQTGSVEVKNLFAAERYQTLYQMTSEVQSRLLPGVDFSRLLGALYPCGSVTGAPKIRTMEIIDELEHRPRGVYTGAIGFVAPGGDATFNVPIRTLTIADGRGEMGVGSGVVYDSDAQSEYDECLLKARFLVEATREFSLIETMLWRGTIVNLALHMERLMNSVAYFEFSADENEIRRAIDAFTSRLDPEPEQRVRLLLSRDGGVRLESEDIAPVPAGGIRVRVSAETMSSSDVFRYHKTTDRETYRREYKRWSEEGFHDVIFLNERAEVTEGAISNIFIENNGLFLTPPVSCGLLPGTFRAALLRDNPNFREQVLTLEDLHSAEAVFLTNAVRGLIRVDHLELASRP